MTDKPPLIHDDMVEQEVQRMQMRRAALEAEEPAARQADLDSWRLCDELTVAQAALLQVGVSPSSQRGLYWHEGDAERRPLGMDATLSALTRSIQSGGLKATLRYKARVAGVADTFGELNDGEYFARLPVVKADDPLVPSAGDIPSERGLIINYAVSRLPDWDLSTVMVEDLRAWLRSRGVTSGFFFANAPESVVPGYLDPAHERFAPKLAAAVRAWEAVTDSGKSSPKKALQKWLNQHAAALGLTLKDGRPNSKAVDEAATVANWKPEGGAPRTKD